MLSMVLFLGVVVAFLFDSKYKFVSLLRIKYIERSIRKHSTLLKEYSEADQIPVLNSLLLNMFRIYEKNTARTVSMIRLFPENESTLRGELDEYEEKVRNRLAPYYALYQNIARYHETEYGRSITLSELRRLI